MRADFRAEFRGPAEGEVRADRADRVTAPAVPAREPDAENGAHTRLADPDTLTTLSLLRDH